MYCNYCRSVNPEDAIYCSACGRNITGSIQTNAHRKTEEVDAHAQSPPTVQAQEPIADEGPIWNFKEMSDDELEQLREAHGKLHKPIEDSLRMELEQRASRRLQIIPTVTVPPPASIPQVDSTEPFGSTVSPQAVQQKVLQTPYARFVICVLACCLSASMGVFAFFEALARNTTAFAMIGLSILLTVAVAFGGWKTWQRIRTTEPNNELKAKRRVRNTIVTSGIFILLYLGVAALLGSVIGQNRSESIQFNFDAGRQKELAERISKARNAVSATVPSYLEMYIAIEPDVKAYASTVARLRAELGIYDSKFPAQHEGTQKYRTVIDREIRRSELLTRQIAVAKQIGSLDQYQQWAAWQRDMAPLLNEEDGLTQPR